MVMLALYPCGSLDKLGDAKSFLLKANVNPNQKARKMRTSHEYLMGKFLLHIVHAWLGK